MGRSMSILLSDDAEINLFSSFENIKTRVEKGIAENDFNFALERTGRTCVHRWMLFLMELWSWIKTKISAPTGYPCLRKYRLSFIKLPIFPKLLLQVDFLLIAL